MNIKLFLSRAYKLWIPLKRVGKLFSPFSLDSASPKILTAAMQSLEMFSRPKLEKINRGASENSKTRIFNG